MLLAVQVSINGFTAAVVRATEIMLDGFIRQMANSDVLVSGIEGTMQVRAGMDPRYDTEENLQRLIADLLVHPERQTGDAYDRFLTPENRARLAAAALRGWVQTHDTPRQDALTWHRMMNGVMLQVGRQL